MAYRLTGQYKEAIETAKEALQHVPNNIFIYLQLAATYSMMGRERGSPRRRRRSSKNKSEVFA